MYDRWSLHFNHDFGAYYFTARKVIPNTTDICLSRKPTTKFMETGVQCTANRKRKQKRFDCWCICFACIRNLSIYCGEHLNKNAELLLMCFGWMIFESTNIDPNISYIHTFICLFTYTFLQIFIHIFDLLICFPRFIHFVWLCLRHIELPPKSISLPGIKNYIGTVLSHILCIYVHISYVLDSLYPSCRFGSNRLCVQFDVFYFNQQILIFLLHQRNRKRKFICILIRYDSYEGTKKVLEW